MYLIKGGKWGIVKSSRGIRQGDPISSFLFVFAIDYLNRLLNLLEEKGSIKGVEFNPSCSLNHLLFANDILIFIDDNDKYLKNLKIATKLFELASGLQINIAKSTISPINVNFERTKNIADS